MIFSPDSLFSLTFDELSARYKWNILVRAIKPKLKKKEDPDQIYSAASYLVLHCLH